MCISQPHSHARVGDAMPRTGNLDVVLWGATGFTGQLVAEYFASSISKRLPTLNGSQ